MEDVLTLSLLGALLVLVVLDFLAPARTFVEVRFWRLRGIAAFVMFMAVSTAAPMMWDGLLGEHRILDASGLGPWIGGVAGLVALQFFQYWWHRALHRLPLLWRHLHQTHHSAERVDIWGAFWFHPLDMIGFTFVGSFALVFVFGVSAEAALVANTLGGLLASFNHANIATPAWLGLFIQRPENHALHHERGVHAYNYGDIALWDMVFGTYRNPATWNGRAGFWDGASDRIGALLVGVDVSDPTTAARRRR
jgi:sterol desaturase/sphingolipid hydroxylase (fatty acid hydroxylase superfamily)